eukprot:TRINITY_DN6532_c0_g1_i1.p1 TRINITY_DN6532_c0_g1~~TRINITY_DN6532_c0_g1_i1.p1  ORF type:complete len:764 (+),score=116.22 TRINITY_DN6532_c0_g1_i1:73-2364(+)
MSSTIGYNATKGGLKPFDVDRLMMRQRSASDVVLQDEFSVEDVDDFDIVPEFEDAKPQPVLLDSPEVYEDRPNPLFNPISQSAPTLSPTEPIQSIILLSPRSASRSTPTLSSDGAHPLSPRFKTGGTVTSRDLPRDDSQSNSSQPRIAVTESTYEPPDATRKSTSYLTPGPHLNQPESNVEVLQTSPWQHRPIHDLPHMGEEILLSQLLRQSSDPNSKYSSKTVKGKRPESLHSGLQKSKTTDNAVTNEKLMKAKKKHGKLKRGNTNNRSSQSVLVLNSLRSKLGVGGSEASLKEGGVGNEFAQMRASTGNMSTTNSKEPVESKIPMINVNNKRLTLHEACLDVKDSHYDDIMNLLAEGCSEQDTFDLTNLSPKCAIINTKNDQGWNALHCVCYRLCFPEDFVLIYALLAYGIDVNLTTTDLSNTVLHFLACHCPSSADESEKLGEALERIQKKSLIQKRAMNVNKSQNLIVLSDGADEENGIINFRNKNGETPLHKAVEQGNLAVISEFLIRGGDLYAKDANDETLLHYAVKRGHQEIIEKLLMLGLKPDDRNKNRSETCFDLANKIEDANKRALITKQMSKYSESNNPSYNNQGPQATNVNNTQKPAEGSAASIERTNRFTEKLQKLKAVISKMHLEMRNKIKFLRDKIAAEQDPEVKVREMAVIVRKLRLDVRVTFKSLQNDNPANPRKLREVTLEENWKKRDREDVVKEIAEVELTNLETLVDMLAEEIQGTNQNEEDVKKVVRIGEMTRSVYELVKSL